MECSQIVMQTEVYEFFVCLSFSESFLMSCILQNLVLRFELMLFTDLEDKTEQSKISAEGNFLQWLWFHPIYLLQSPIALTEEHYCAQERITTSSSSYPNRINNSLPALLLVLVEVDFDWEQSGKQTSERPSMCLAQKPPNSDGGCRSA